MNNKLMFSSDKEDWETPTWLFNKLDKEFKFTLDPCCTEKTAKCKLYYTKKENGLIKSWDKNIVFVNPPYGKEISKWVRKSYLSSEHGATVVMLIPSRTDTNWFHNYIYNKPFVEIRFLRGRIKFLQNGKLINSAPFPSAIVIFKEHDKDIPTFSTLEI